MDETGLMTADAMLQAHTAMDLAARATDIEYAARAQSVKMIRLADFKERYINVRAANPVLSHEAAVELTKHFYKEAEHLTVDDLP